MEVYLMSTARRAYAAPAPVDRTRSATVRTREAERRVARALKLRPTQLDLDQLQRELSTVEVAR